MIISVGKIVISLNFITEESSLLNLELVWWSTNDGVPINLVVAGPNAAFSCCAVQYRKRPETPQLTFYIYSLGEQ